MKHRLNTDVERKGLREFRELTRNGFLFVGERTTGFRDYSRNSRGNICVHLSPSAVNNSEELS